MTTRLAALALVFLPGTALANRIVSYSVHVEGGPSLSARDMDNGDAPMAAVWRRLGSAELKPESGKPAVTPDAANPLQATLEGDVRVAVNQFEVRVKELRLVRATEQGGWSVHPDDVEATAKQAGLGVIPPGPTPEPEQPLKRPNTVWYAVAVVLIGLGAGLMARRRRKARQANRQV